jgi:serine/threonine protein kinase
MTPEGWARVKELFDASLEKSPDERLKFLAEACEGDDVLRHEVERLIAEHERAGDFLVSPPWAKTTESSLRAEPTAEGSGKATAEPHSTAAAVWLKRGDTFTDRYEIKTELGRGGFGIVYSAFDRGPLQRTVALKVIRFALAEGPAPSAVARQRFLEEARVAGNLSHNNIAAVFDVGESSGCVYMTQELAQGRDLRKILIETKRLPLRRILAITRQICEGLAHAHGRNIVHRDIKPGNIVVSADDRVKITDFGLAQPPQGEDSTLDKIIAGTPGYMAPEQLRGERVDGRADIFALGIVLYQMLTGRAPFEGATAASVIEKTLYTFPPDPSKVREDAPHTLDRVVARAMKKDPDDRYNNVTQFQQDLLNHEQFAYVIDANVGADKIATALEARQCSLFVGLCLPVSLHEKHSRTVENVIADYLAERLSSPGSDHSLSRLAQDLEIERGRAEMLKYLTAAVRNPSVSPREIIARIAQLRFPVVITTGYDTFLEEELAKVSGKFRRVLNGTSVPDDSTDADLLVPLFGSLESEASVVVTEDDLWKFFSAFNSLSDALKSRFARDCLLFVGYDPEDEGFRHLFAEIARYREGGSMGCYLANVDIAIPSVRWAERKGLQLIDARPDSFLSLVEETITEKRREKFVPQVDTAEPPLAESSLPQPPQRHRLLDDLWRLLRSITRRGGSGDGKDEQPELVRKARVLLTKLLGGLERLPAPLRPPYFWLESAAVVLMLVLVVGVALHSKSQGIAKPKLIPPTPVLVKFDASPWASIKEIRNIRTQQQINLPDPNTPVELPLLPGDYEVVFENPALGRLPFTLHVDPGVPQEVRKAYPGFDPGQVLKDYH